MNEQTNNELPAHLRELVSPTPSGFAKLIAAWEGLDTETQILLLHEIKQLSKSGRHYFDKTFLIVALKSPNPYVRYLAAKEFHPYATEEINQLIENDPDPLVRFCKKEDTWNFIFSDEFKDPKAFFEMPHEARLSTVRSLRGRGEEIAKLISYAVDNELKKGAVTKDELLEILVDYVNRAEFKNYYKEDILSYDGWGEFQKGKDIKSLWNLVLKVPERISHIIIQHVPAKAGLSTGIPDNVLKNMSIEQLKILFYRPDVGLTEFRKEIFLKNNNYDLKAAASTCNFDLTYDEFAEILKKPEDERYKILKELIWAHDLSLCLYDALHDILFSGPRFEDAEWPRRILEQKLKSLKSKEKGRQLRELRLYRLAKQTVPWKKEKGYLPSNELNFLRDVVIEGDTWETFMSFSKAWEQNRSAQKLEKYLPRIHELDEDTIIDAADVEDSSQITKRIEKKLSEISSKLRTDSEGKDTTLADALSQVTSYLTVLQDRTNEELNFLKNQFSGIQDSLNRQKILSVTIFILAIILLILLWK